MSTPDTTTPTTPTVPAHEQHVIRATVGDLTGEDTFSLDDGNTWHTCATAENATLTVYTDERRDQNAPTRPMTARHDHTCLVRLAWTRLWDNPAADRYARVDCGDCGGTGLLDGEPSDTLTCGCVREAAAVPERLFHVLVEETSTQWATVRARAVNEADTEGETAVQVGDGYDEKFTNRRTIEIHLGRAASNDNEPHLATT